ncbi:winged helix-turn-helix domain-containing protein [Halalkalicoccus salilacus]|uniref:winged helix-turn-helix domain-containing protein n=1 Tax=Halalkalicoccus salilacus TaxID=3117459 RepID=UPI00300ED80A
MRKPTTHEELQAALTDDRYRILEVLAEHDELRSSKIRDCAGIPDGSTHYQLSMLDSWDLITPVRTQYVGEYENGIPATVYTLTEEGRTLVEGW